MGTPDVQISATIALLTDFGLADPYVGQLKGRLMREAPQSALLDISHGVVPHQIEQGAFFLDVSIAHLPQPCVVLAVVDPGVGTQRGALIARSEDRLVVAPDNGLLALFLKHHPLQGLWRANPPKGLKSATFHARDWFGPLAASLARGKSAAACGEPYAPEQIRPLPQNRPEHAPHTTGVSWPVLHIDRFGNTILGLRQGSSAAAEITAAPQLRCPACGDTPVIPAQTYAAIPPGTIGLVPGSQGYYELALNQDVLAQRFGLRLGQVLHFEPL